MKKVALMALAAMAFFSCSQDEMPTTPDSNEEPVVVLKINVQGAVNSRSIEDGHPGNDAQPVYPKIFNGAIIPYNEHGVAMSAITIDKDQIKGALIGDYYDSNGALIKGDANGDTGLKVGLPRGTKKVDVVLNRFTAAEQGVTNINYFNMQDYKDLNDKPINNGTTSNFERVPLVTKYQGVGMELVSKTKEAAKAAAKPSYEVEFTVSPNLARFEVFGAINVAKPTTWIDKYKNQWYQISKEEFAKINTGSSPITFTDEGAGSDFGLMQANDKNGFGDKNGAVYIPEYYYYVRADLPGGTKEPIIKEGEGSNVFTRDEIDNKENNINAGWVRQVDPFLPHMIANNSVEWTPNVFYAIDVEEIFINNIKIRDASFTPSMHNWPGSESPTWKDWYNAFHLFGWHQNGVSADNTFLCRANMWDRIADADSKDKTMVQIPAIGGFEEMEVITGKAKPTSKSAYIAEPMVEGKPTRNLGILDKKAAAYQIYAQSSTLADIDANKDGLANDLPHIILKIKAYKTAKDYADGTKVAQKEFITIKLFKDNANKRIRAFNAGSIYRLDINDLLSSFVGEIPVPGGVSDKTPTDPVEPDPEMPGADLTVKVSIVPWTIINMKPEI